MKKVLLICLLSFILHPTLQAQNVLIKKRSKPNTPIQPSPATKVKTKTVIVNRNQDRDNDGIIDDKDDCPDEYGPIKNGGCPLESPKDPVTAHTKSKKDLLSYEPVMVYVGGGSFEMGSNDDKNWGAKPVHQVTLTDYYIGKYEVTQAQWKAVMGGNPSWFKDCDNCPVDRVSWDSVQVYLRKLNKLTNKTYRLPTEAEWEYAARGGKESRGYVYSGSTNAESVGWIDSNSDNKTHEVGSKQPNELGLYDMSGNVWEWCNDWYDDYSSNGSSNPTGPSIGTARILRGGGWAHSALLSQVANRSVNTPEHWNYLYGFRVVLVP